MNGDEEGSREETGSEEGYCEEDREEKVRTYR